MNWSNIIQQRLVIVREWERRLPVADIYDWHFKEGKLYQWRRIRPRSIGDGVIPKRLHWLRDELWEWRPTP